MVKGNRVQSLRFNKPDEKMVYFELDVSKSKGINTVEVIATGNGEKSSYVVEIGCRKSKPYNLSYC